MPIDADLRVFAIRSVRHAIPVGTICIMGRSVATAEIFLGILRVGNLLDIHRRVVC